MIVESRPWVLGQSLTHTNGLLYVATGTGSYKAAAPEEVVVEVEPIRQEHFYPGDVLPGWMIDEVQVCLIDGTLVDVYDTEQLPENVNGMVIVDAVTGMPTFNQKPVKLEDQRQTVYGVGDTLPEWMAGKVNVCLLITGEVVELCDDEAIPDDIDGTVIVDALTGVPTYNQGAQKPVPVVKPIVTQLDEPTKEDVESGVCIWRNRLDGCLYTVTIEDDGSCTWFSSDKNDTNTFATVIEAPAAGVDDYGNQYSASQDLIVWADNTIMAMTVDTDTVDGYSEQGVSDGSQLDAQGNPIPAGNKITTYYDATGAVVNSRDDEKTQGSTTTPSADGLGQVITTSDNETTFVCDKQFKGLRDNGDGTKTEIFVDQAGVESTGLTLEEPTQSGEPQLGVVDAAGNTTYVDADGATQTVPATDLNGDPVDPSQAVWNMIDGNGNYLGSKPCKDETVLSMYADFTLPDIDPETGNQLIAKLVDCAGSTLSGDVSVRQHGEFDSLIVLPDLPDCPDGCKPPDAPCAKEGFVISDPTGTTWTKAAGAAVTAWVITRKGYYTEKQCGTFVFPAWFLAASGDEVVAAGASNAEWAHDGADDDTSFTEIVNDTCQPITVTFQLRIHSDIGYRDDMLVGMYAQAHIGGVPLIIIHNIFGDQPNFHRRDNFNHQTACFAIPAKDSRRVDMRVGYAATDPTGAALLDNGNQVINPSLSWDYHACH